MVSELDSGLSGRGWSLDLACCVLGQDTLLSKYLSLPTCIHGNCNLMLGGDPAMD